VPGERAVRELLHARPSALHTLLIAQGREFPELEALAAKAGANVRRRPTAGLDARVGEGLARGIIAIADPPPTMQLEDVLDIEGPGLVVALDEVVDPRNLGAIMRSAEFFGARAVVVPEKRTAPLSPAAVRASAGATERLPRCVVGNLVRGLERAKSRDFWVVGTLPKGGQSLRGFEPPERAMVVLGGEQRGMRRLVTERCDMSVTIDGGGALASLNVSAAAAVVLSRFARG
jgi:23S rRNA (guanosine2251-2'-O)-methyltransferase